MNTLCEINSPWHGSWHVPVPIEEETTQEELWTVNRSPRPESGLDCLTCAEIAWQRPQALPRELFASFCRSINFCFCRGLLFFSFTRTNPPHPTVAIGRLKRGGVHILSPLPSRHDLDWMDEHDFCVCVCVCVRVRVCVLCVYTHTHTHTHTQVVFVDLIEVVRGRVSQLNRRAFHPAGVSAGPKARGGNWTRPVLQGEVHLRTTILHKCAAVPRRAHI